MVNGRSNPNPRGVAHNEITVQALIFLHRKSNHIQVIINIWVEKNLVAVLDTGAQYYMIIIVCWETVKRCDSCIDEQGVNMGLYSKGWRCLLLIDARVMVNKI